MRAFTPNDTPTIGVEQEFHLVDPITADLTGLMEKVWGALTGPLEESITHELYLSVLESRSQVARTVDELVASLARDRRELADACEAAGALLVAAGSHPFAHWDRQTLVDSDHYRWVRHHHGYIADRMLAFSLHVHVGMRSAPAAIYAMNEMRRWAFPLLALSANSPYFEGRLTGLASTRWHLFSSMPRTGMPPHFDSFADLEALYDKLVAAGDITRPGDLWWCIRPQPPLGTLELRVFDLPTDLDRLGALVAIVQAAVAHYQDQFDTNQPPSRLNPAYLDQNAWKAMRYNLDAQIIEPETAEIITIRDQLTRLLDLIAPKATELASRAWIDLARETLHRPTESQQQVQLAQSLDNDLPKLELELARRTVNFPTILPP